MTEPLKAHKVVPENEWAQSVSPGAAQEGKRVHNLARPT